MVHGLFVTRGFSFIFNHGFSRVEYTTGSHSISILLMLGSLSSESSVESSISVRSLTFVIGLFSRFFFKFAVVLDSFF